VAPQHPGDDFGNHELYCTCIYHYDDRPIGGHSNFGFAFLSAELWTFSHSELFETLTSRALLIEALKHPKKAKALSRFYWEWVKEKRTSGNASV
jgi:hypothetical protein